MVFLQSYLQLQQHVRNPDFCIRTTLQLPETVSDIVDVGGEVQTNDDDGGNRRGLGQLVLGGACRRPVPSFAVDTPMCDWWSRRPMQPAGRNEEEDAHLIQQPERESNGK